MARIVARIGAHLNVTLINKTPEHTTLLNEKCGADYVYKSGQNPEMETELAEMA